MPHKSHRSTILFDDRSRTSSPSGLRPGEHSHQGPMLRDTIRTAVTLSQSWPGRIRGGTRELAIAHTPTWPPTIAGGQVRILAAAYIATMAAALSGVPINSPEPV